MVKRTIAFVLSLLLLLSAFCETPDVIVSEIFKGICSDNDYSLRLIRAAQANGIYTVEIETEKATESAQLLSDLGSSLTDLGLCNAVCLFVDGRYSGLYSGSSNCVIYYASNDHNFVVPCLLSADSVTAESLLRLMNAQAPACLEPALSFSEDTVISFSYTSNGQRFVSVDFPMSVYDSLISGGIERWQFLAAIVLTLTSNITDVDYVTVSFDGNLIQSVYGADGRPMSFSDGLISRNAFCGNTGTIVNGNTVIPCSYSFDARINALIKVDALTASDVISVTLDGTNAIIELSEEFVSRCSDFTLSDEKDFVFSCVNILCELPGINSVSFSLNGKPLETLAGHIKTGSALLPVNR